MTVTLVALWLLLDVPFAVLARRSAGVRRGRTGFARKPIVPFVTDRDIRIVDADGELLRALVLDPTRDYERQSA